MFNKEYLEEVCKEKKNEIIKSLEKAWDYEMPPEDKNNLPGVLEEYLITQMKSNFQYDFGFTMDWEKLLNKDNKGE